MREEMSKFRTYVGHKMMEKYYGIILKKFKLKICKQHTSESSSKTFNILIKICLSP